MRRADLRAPFAEARGDGGIGRHRDPANRRRAEPVGARAVGLSSALRHLAERASARCMRPNCGWHSDAAPSLCRQRSRRWSTVWRRNLMLNIVKHSRAKCVKLSLRAADSCIRLSVSDDGAGFQDEAAVASWHRSV